MVTREREEYFGTFKLIKDRKTQTSIVFDSNPLKNFIPNIYEYAYGLLTKLNPVDCDRSITMKECSVWNLQSLKTSTVLSKVDENHKQHADPKLLNRILVWTRDQNNIILTENLK